MTTRRWAWRCFAAVIFSTAAPSAGHATVYDFEQGIPLSDFFVVQFEPSDPFKNFWDVTATEGHLSVQKTDGSVDPNSPDFDDGSFTIFPHIQYINAGLLSAFFVSGDFAISVEYDLIHPDGEQFPEWCTPLGTDGVILSLGDFQGNTLAVSAYIALPPLFPNLCTLTTASQDGQFVVSPSAKQNQGTLRLTRRGDLIKAWISDPFFPGRFTLLGSTPSASPGIVGILGAQTSVEQLPGFLRATDQLHVNFDNLLVGDFADLADELLTFFNEAVAAGTIRGEGPGNSPQGILGALRNMLQTLQGLLLAGAYEQACTQLADILGKVDGKSPPPDFTAGPANPELANRVLDLQAVLGCP